MNIKAICSGLTDKTDYYANVLTWKDGCKAPKGKQVEAFDVGREFDCDADMAKAAITHVKKVKDKELRDMDAGAKRTAAEARVEARDAEARLTEIVIGYLKPRLRLHYRDKTYVMYTYFDDKLELYKISFMPTRAIHLSELAGYLRQRDPVAYDAMRTRVNEELELTEQAFADANRARLDFMAIMLRAVESLLSLEHPDVVLPEDLPILSWDRDALLRLDPALLRPGKWPHIKEYMKRVSHPRELMAFIWKCFDPTDFGRQIVWSQSLGHSGQSTFWSVVFSKLEKIAVSLSKSSNQDKHTLAECYLKRFAMVSDCSNKYFYSTELVKQLSGNDQASVRQMFKEAFAARLFCRVVALSNIAPEVDTTSNAMRTRLLYFTVKPFPESQANPEVEREYHREFWHFLHACKKVHDEMCVRDAEGKSRPIPMPDSMWQAIRIRCDKPVRNTARAFVEERVRLDPEGEILQTDLFKEFKKYYMDHMRLGSEAAGLLANEREAVVQAFDNLIFALLDSDPDKIQESSGGLKKYCGVRLVAPARTSDDDEDLNL